MRLVFVSTVMVMGGLVKKTNALSDPYAPMARSEEKKEIICQSTHYLISKTKISRELSKFVLESAVFI